MDYIDCNSITYYSLQHVERHQMGLAMWQPIVCESVNDKSWSNVFMSNLPIFLRILSLTYLSAVSLSLHVALNKW